MTPTLLLLIVLSITAGAYLTFFLQRQRVSRQLQRLARDWHMHYSPRDKLRLAARVAQSFPVPGAANLRIFDLIYGVSGDSHRYIFTAEYTVGVLKAKHRETRIATFTEHRSASHTELPPAITLADSGLPKLSQYQSLGPTDG